MTSGFRVADADRLLSFADEFINDIELNEPDIDPDVKGSIEEYRQLRPILIMAPAMLKALQSVAAMIAKLNLDTAAAASTDFPIERKTP